MTTGGQELSEACKEFVLIAPERFESWKKAGDDDLAPIARYVWNIHVSKSLLPWLHGVEICFRNRLHQQLTNLYGPAWHDEEALVSSKLLRKVNEAKETLKRQRKPMETGRLIAELSFGFWTDLYSNQNEQSIIRPTIKQVFPHYSGAMALNRSMINPRLRDARRLRNRIAHLEPVANDASLAEQYERLRELVAWMHPEMHAATTVRDNFLHLYGENWRPFYNELAIEFQMIMPPSDIEARRGQSSASQD